MNKQEYIKLLEKTLIILMLDKHKNEQDLEQLFKEMEDKLIHKLITGKLDINENIQYIEK